MLLYNPTFSYIAQIDNGNIILSPFSKEIYIYSIEANQMKELHKIIATNEKDACVCSLSNNRFITYSREKNIEVWKGEAPYNNDQPLKVIEYKANGAKQLEGKEVLLVGNLSRGHVTLFETENFTIIKEYFMELRSNNIIEIDEDNVVIEAKLLNLKTGENENLGDVWDTTYYNSIKLRDGRILCCGNYENERTRESSDNLILIDPKNKTKEKKAFTHVMQFCKIDDQSFISVQDWKAKLWKY